MAMPEIRCSSAATPQARLCYECRHEKDAAYNHRGKCKGLQYLTSTVQDLLIHLCHKFGVENPWFNPLHPGDYTINFCRAFFILHEGKYDDESFDFQRCPCGQLTDVASTRRSSSHETIREYFCKERARNYEKGGVLCSSNMPWLH